MRWVPIFILLLLGVAPWPASAGDARLYLSWRAPYGSPRATDTAWVACGEMAHADTLFLSFDPGRDDSTFFGMMGTVYFRAQGRDTLGPYWKTQRGQTYFPDLQISYGPDGSFEAPTPWTSSGLGVFYWDFERTSGRLRLAQGVSPAVAGPVRGGTIYTFARIVLRPPPANLALCRQPICVEWWLATLTFELDGEEPQINKGGSRFVTMNMPRGKECSDLSAGEVAPKPWSPPKK
jgi:hypothetical protein